MWLFDVTTREDRVSVFGLHPFEGHGVRRAEFASHHYTVYRPGTFAYQLSTAALHIAFFASEINARQEGSSSPTGAFPLGDLSVRTVGLLRLDEPPGMGFLHGFAARGDAELAVDGLDLGPYRACGHVEALCYLGSR